MEIVRQINVEFTIAAEEEEQQRRVHEYEVAKVQEQLLRERSKSEAVAAMENERARRLSELAQDEQAVDKQRRASKDAVQRAVESERVRRLSLPEHLERAPSARMIETEISEASPTKDMSEIPVEPPATDSKILVDEHSEWRCFIASENPEVEKDCLRGEFGSLIVDGSFQINAQLAMCADSASNQSGCGAARRASSQVP